MSRLPNPNRPGWQLRVPLFVAGLSALVAFAGASLALWKAWSDTSKGEPVVITLLVGVVLLAIVIKESLQLYRSVEETRRQLTEQLMDKLRTERPHLVSEIVILR
jgi:divalent metal cation (Fe/Co/Zn/Cd) transporter